MRVAAAQSGILGILFALSGCGGGSGGVSSASTTPVNTSLANLVASQSFANVASTGLQTASNTNHNVVTNGATSMPLVISYDLASNTYTITTQQRTQSFGPASLTSAANGTAVYTIAGGSTSDTLTLSAASVAGANASAQQYSGLGIWERVAAQPLGVTGYSFDFFVYGLETAASAVPRTGQGAYAVTVVGLTTRPAYEARQFTGTGRFDIDFVNNLFSTSAYVTETGVISQTNYGSGGLISATGTVSSSANSLTGTLKYDGLNSHSTGPITGSLFGPAGQELGATFAATGNDGSATAGAFWGIQSAQLTPVNLSLLNIAADQTFISQGAQMLVSQISDTATTTINNGVVTVYAKGGTTITPYALPVVTVTGNNLTTSSNANFQVYNGTNANSPITVQLYKQGKANTELALSYMNFGSWQGTAASSVTGTSWFVYGFATDQTVLAAKTGTASYTGIAYGSTYNGTANTSGSVSGTSSFAVDFGAGKYTGNFGLKNSATDYGTFNVAGTITSGVVNQGSVTGVTAGSGTIAPNFYGATAREFGGPFSITLPAANTTIVGVAAGKTG